MPVKTVPSVIIGSGSNKSIVNNIYNNDFGNTIITGYLTVDFYLTVDGNLTVGGNFDLDGAFELSGDITVKNPSDVTVFSVDSATGDTLTKGDITVKDSSDVTVFSVDSATGDTLTKGDITVKDSSDVTKFSVDSATGDTLTKGDITVKNSSDVTVFSVDSATGDTLTKGDITVKNSSDVTVFSVDSATGDTLTKGDITVKNSSDVTVFSVDSATGDTLTKGDITVKDSSDVTKFSVDSATGNTTIEGDLTVNGTTTTIDSVTLVVEDPVITLAKNANSNPTASTDAGLFLQRGSTENPAIIIWNETLNQFEVATVTGASSTTTNFTGGGVTKTFATFKGGNIYGNDMFGSSIDITGTGSFGVLSSGSLAIGEHSFDINGIVLGEYGNLNINSVQDYSSIILNYNVISGIPSANAVIEVKRGSSTSSKITWDEYNNNWDINTNLYSQKIRIRTDETSGSSSRVYIYFTHALGIFSENVYFYIYKTSNSGLTREVVPINIISTTRLQSYTSNGYSEVRFNNNTPYSSHANADAFIDMEDGASYYININSTNASGLFPNVSFLFRYRSNEGNYGYTYTTVANADFIATGGYNGLIQVNNATNLVTQAFSAGTAIYDNVDNLPTLSLEYSKGIGSIVLNSGVTDTPTDASILVDRGLSSSATLLWDESQTSWVINQDIRLITDGVNTSSLYLQDSGCVWINDGILALESRSSNTTRIYLNSELDVGDTPTTDAKITVNRGNQTNAEIQWDEANDRWNIEPSCGTLNLVSNAYLKINKQSSTTNPVIVLNADRTGAGQEADVVAIEVERGTDTNSYIKWDESNDSWLVSPKINLTHNLTPYYVYIKYNLNSFGNNEYFHFFSSTNNGTTREVIELYDLDGTHFTEDTSLGFSRYKASSGSSWTQSPRTLTGVIYFEPGKDYFLEIRTDNITNTNGVQIYISSFFLPTDPPYTDIIYGFGPSPNFFQLIQDQTIDATNWSGPTPAMNGASSASNYYPSSTLITLNDNNRDTYEPVDSPKIEVDRGTQTNSYIKWDEVNDTWNVYPNILATPKLYFINAGGTIDLTSGSIFHLTGGPSPYTLTLPDATIDGTTIHIKNLGSSQKTIVPGTIDATTGHQIKLDYLEAISLYWYGGWNVLSIYGNVTIN
jgi:hypothetical protein